MTREVEFLDVGDVGADVDDPPERLSRGFLWFFWRAGGAAAAMMAVVAALLLRPGTSPRAPTPPPTAPAPSPPVTLTIPPPDPFGAANITLVYGGGRLFGLSLTRLGVLNSAGGKLARRSRPIALDPATQDSFRLVWDGRHAAVWVVPVFGRQPGLLREYGTDLRLRRTVQLPDVAHAATVLDGILYVSTNAGIVRVPARGQPRPVPLPHRRFERYGSFGEVLSDPARDRLLYLDYGYAAYLATWSPRTGRSSAVRLTTANPTVAVVQGQIWVAGFRRSHASVQRLDPRTLRVAGSSEVVANLGPGAVIVGAGRSSLLVRSGTDPDPLWCLDADRGTVRQRWPGPDGTVSGAGRALFVAASPRVTRLPVSGCPG